MNTLCLAMVSPGLSWVVPVCLGIVVLALLAKPLRLLLRFLLSAAAGGVGLWLCRSLGFAVGINPVTLAIMGILGFPGLLGLLVLSFFL